MIPFWWKLGGIIVMIAGLGLWIESLRLTIATQALTIQADESARALAKEKVNELVGDWAKNLVAAQAAHDLERISILGKLDSLRAAHDRDSVLANGLRQQLSTYAGGGSSPDTLAAARDRASALGNLLGSCNGLLQEGAGLSIELAGAAEQHASDVRALESAWPHQ
jgi:hypothetical protein